MKNFLQNISEAERQTLQDRITSFLTEENLPVFFEEQPVAALILASLECCADEHDVTPLVGTLLMIAKASERANAALLYLESLEHLDFVALFNNRDERELFLFLRDSFPVLCGWLRRARRLLIDELQHHVAERELNRHDGIEKKLDILNRRAQRLQALLNTLLSTTGDVFVIVTDARGHIRNVSLSVQEILGYRQNDVEGKPSELLHPAKWVESGNTLTIHKMLMANGYWNGELPYQHRNGEQLQAVVSLTNVHGLNGERLGTVCLGHDISEHRRMQQQLLEYTNDLQQIVEERRRDLDESEELYRLLIEDINEGYFIAKGGRFIFTNKAFDRITGYSRDELKHLGFLDLIHERSLNHARSWWLRVMDGAHVPAAELMVQRKGTSKAIVECKAQPLKLRGEAHVIGMLHNITEKKKMERQLQRYVGNLEKMVAERTAELENSIRELKSTQFQLVKSQKLAGIGILAAGVAHEINNPLQALLLKSQYIMRHIDDTHEVTRSTRDIIDYVNRMAEIVRGLSKYARTVKDDVRSAPVNLITVIKESLELAYHTRNFGDVVVRREFNTVQPVLGNEGQFQQIFINLIVNAIDAMEGRGQLTLRLDKEGEMVVARVSDNGCGIPPEHMDKIFTPLFTTKPSGKGTGMGLHVAYRIISEFGGDIAVKSTVGQGTTFTLSFPAAAADPGETLTPTTI